MKKLLLLGACIACMPAVSNAQFWEFGIMLGASNYSGDLSPTPIVFKETHPAFGGIVRGNVNPYLTIKANIYYGSLSGTDENSETPKNIARNLHFKTNLLEVGVNAEVNLTGFEANSRDNRTSPYLFAGLGLFKIDPMALYNHPDEGEMWVRLQPLGTEGQGTTQYQERTKYALTQVAIPFGVGLKHNFAGNWNVGMEMGWRKTFTDYIDDVSMTYVPDHIVRTASGETAANLADRSVELTGEERVLGETNQPRGNSTNKDWFLFGGVTITYTILPQACYRF